MTRKQLDKLVRETRLGWERDGLRCIRGGERDIATRPMGVLRVVLTAEDSLGNLVVLTTDGRVMQLYPAEVV